MYIQETFNQSGNYDLFPEFIETLVNDTHLSNKLRRQIWTLSSFTVWAGHSTMGNNAVIDIVASFQDSEDASDLAARWLTIVNKYWPLLPDCPLKSEINRLEN